MKYLFVGGPKHGEMMNVPSNHNGPVLAPVFERPLPTDWAKEIGLPTPDPIRVCEYYRTDVGTDRIVYIARSVSR